MEFGEIIVNAVEFRDHVPSNTSNKMYMSGGVLYYNGTPAGSYVLPTASASVLGGVKIGSGLAIDGSGVLSVVGGSANMVTTDTAQTITGAKIIGGVTFNNADHDSSLSVEDILTGEGIGADLLWRNAIPNTAVVARAFVALDGGPGEHDVEFSLWAGAGIWTQRTVYATNDLIIGRTSEIRGTITPALTLKTSGGTPYRVDFAVPLTIASGTPSSTTDALYNNSGTLMWNGNPLGGGSYTLPAASAAVLGGVKIGSGLIIDGSGTASVGGVVTVSSLHIQNNGATEILMFDPVGPVDAKNWSIYGNGGAQLLYRTWNDAYTTANVYMQVNRSGNTVTSVDYSALVKMNAGYGIQFLSGAPADTSIKIYNNGGTLYWDGNPITINGVTLGTDQTITGAKTFSAVLTSASIHIVGTTGGADLYTMDPLAGTDQKAWSIFTGNNALRFRTWNDAGNAYSEWMAAVRNGNTVSSLDVSTVLNATASIQLANLVPSTTTNRLYNNNGTLYWNGSAVGGSAPENMVTTDSVQTISGGKTFTSATTMSRLTISSDQPANVSLMRGRPASGASNANLLVDLYSAWDGNNYSGPALYFGRSNGNGWFTSTPGSFFFSGNGGFGSAENMYFGAATTAVVAAAQCSLVLEVDTQKLFLGGLMSSASTRKIQSQGGVYVKDTGIEIASDTPASTANTLYNVSGVLYWNGSSVVPSNMVTTDTDQTISGLKTFSGTLTVGTLTNGRITRATTNGALTDDAGLTTIQTGSITRSVIVGNGTTTYAYVASDSAVAGYSMFVLRQNTVERAGVIVDTSQVFRIRAYDSAGTQIDDPIGFALASGSDITIGGGAGTTRKVVFTNAISIGATYGIVGVTNASSAGAGYVGEVIESNIASGSAVTLTSGTNANVTSITLTAGDWEVSGAVNFVTTSATLSLGEGAISGTTATLTTTGQEGFAGPIQTSASTTTGCAVPARRITVSATTTYYLVALANFSGTSCKAYGTIHAQRRR
jgi:hypothetical protein